MNTKGLAAWLDTWPWTKTLVAAGVLGFALTHVLGLVGMALVVLVPVLRVIGTDHLPLIQEARSWWNDGLQYSIAAATGGVIGLVGKRAATKPDVVKAEAEASAKIIRETAAAVPPLTPAQAAAAARVPVADQEAATKVTPPEQMEGQ